MWGPLVKPPNLYGSGIGEGARGNPLAALPVPDFYSSMDDADVTGSDLGGGMTFVSDGAPPDAPTLVPGSLPGKTAVQFDPVRHQYGLYSSGTLGTHTGDYTVFAHTKMPATSTFLLSSYFTLGTHVIEHILRGAPDYAVSQSYYALRSNGPPDWYTPADLGTVGLPGGSWSDCAQVVDRTNDQVRMYTDGISIGAASLDPLTHGQPLYDIGAASTVAARVSGVSEVYFGTILAEYAIWRSALTFTQIQTLHRLRLMGRSIRAHVGF